MKIFDRIKRVFNFGGGTGLPFEYLLGYNVSTSGKIINPDTAMRISTVFACVRVIAETIASMPCETYVRKEGGDRSRFFNNPLYNVLKFRPNKWQTAFDFWQYGLYSMLLHGFFLCQKITDRFTGDVVSLIPYNPACVEIKQANDGALYFTTKRNGVEERLDASNAFYVAGMAGNGFMPVSIIQYARNSLGLAASAQEHGASMFKNGANPSGVLTTPNSLSEEAVKNLSESWRRAYGGGNNGRVAVLEQDTKFTPITIANKDAQYLETRKFEREEIAGMFRVPLWMISVQGAAKGWSTLEQQQSDFLNMSILPWLTRIEQAIQVQLIQQKQIGGINTAVFSEFNTSAILRGDTKSRYDTYQVGVNGGWLSINDIRRMENMNRIEGGDEYLRPLNMAVVGEKNDEQ